MLHGKVLITGGSGTIGNAIIKRANAEKWPARFSVYSRSEYLQSKMKAIYPNVNYILGDIRDYDRLSASIAGHDTVIHAAAMKRIPECEAQPAECYKTNVTGSLNVIRACKNNNVTRAVFLSTDKACIPITAYGASKLMMEKATQSEYATQTVFTAVRYGNVVESRGSVIPIWKKQAAAGNPITITNPNMSRFWITPDLAVDYILSATMTPASTIFIPKMKALTLAETAEIIAPGRPQVTIGLRSAEREHEYLVSPEELALDLGDHYLISELGELGHQYRSDTAPKFNGRKFLDMLSEVGL